MEADLSTIVLHAHEAIDLVCTGKMPVLGIPETALRAMKLPKGLSDHAVTPLHRIEVVPIRWTVWRLG
jgi:hypothetical protein